MRKSGARILDLGCADGALTSDLLRRRCDVVAVDSRAQMVEAAKRRGLDARVADGQSLQFTDEFDAVVSNAAMHWMSDMQSVLGGVWRALNLIGLFLRPIPLPGDVRGWLMTFAQPCTSVVAAV